jgi:hypothetical protein
LDKFAAMEAEQNRIIQELRPCLGVRWTAKAQRFSKTIGRFRATTSRHYLEMRKKASAAEFSEIPITPTTHIKAAPAAKSFEIKTPLSPPRPRRDDALTLLAEMEDRESRRDSERLVKPSTVPAEQRQARRKSAYIPGMPASGRNW